MSPTSSSTPISAAFVSFPVRESCKCTIFVYKCCVFNVKYYYLSMLCWPLALAAEFDTPGHVQVGYASIPKYVIYTIPYNTIPYHTIPYLSQSSLACLLNATRETRLLAQARSTPLFLRMYACVYVSQYTNSFPPAPMNSSQISMPRSRVCSPTSTSTWYVISGNHSIISLIRAATRSHSTAGSRKFNSLSWSSHNYLKLYLTEAFFSKLY